MTEIDDAASRETAHTQTPETTAAADPQRPTRQAKASHIAASQTALDLYRTQQTAMGTLLQAQRQAQSAAAELVRSPVLEVTRSVQESVAAAQRMYTVPIAELVESMNRRNAAILGESARLTRWVAMDPAITKAVKSAQQTQAALVCLAVPSFATTVAALPQIAEYSRVADLARRQMTRDLAAMNRAWHHGLLPTVPTLPQSLFKPAWPVADVMRQLQAVGAFDLSALNPMASFTAELHRLLRSWWRISGSTEQLLSRLARAGFLAALRARDAAVRGEMGPVVDFIAEWLGMKPIAWRVEAVAAALLEEGWDEQPEAVLTEIGARARRQRRALRPVWETKLGGRPVGLLGEPVELGDGSQGTLADLITDRTTAEEIALFGRFSRRIHIVLSQLKPAERAVALAYASGVDGVDGIGDLWTAAAAQTGAEDPEAFGRRVYRKVRRLGVLYSQRHRDLEH